MIASNTDDLVGNTVVQRRSKGSSEKLAVPCPTVISSYNKGMGGVDLLDQQKPAMDWTENLNTDSTLGYSLTC